MFGFMLDETETHDNPAQAVTCRTCHMRVAQRAPRVVVGQEAYHRECYEATHKKRTGKRPALIPFNGDRVTFRPAA